jgi:hypothetical protein
VTTLLRELPGNPNSQAPLKRATSRREPGSLTLGTHNTRFSSHHFGDVNPQYVCSLVFVFRAVGMVGSALTMPSGSASFFKNPMAVQLVFVAVICIYLLAAAATNSGRMGRWLDRPISLIIDVGGTAAVNIWSASMMPARQLDVGGKDLFWMAMIGAISLWGAIYGRRFSVALLAFSAVVVVAMFRANGSTFSNTNWGFAISRVIFASTGLLIATVGLRIAERFADFRREQGVRAGEQIALGAMHMRTLQDLKVIERLTMEDHDPQSRLDEIRQYVVGLSEYVREWPVRSDDRQSVEKIIRETVIRADPNGTVKIRMGATHDVWVDGGVARALEESIGEATRNVVQHAKSKGTVEVAMEGDCLSVVVVDSGRGIDMAAPKNGIGLRRIHDAVAEVGGSAQLRSSPGAGTSWSILVKTQS